MHFKREKWREAAVKGLGETLRDCEELLREQVENNIAELWCIDGHSWMITRTEYFPNRQPELVVCCYKGEQVKAVTKVIYETAIKQGFGSIRYHTQRPGLNRLVSDLGFEFMESIYHKQIVHKKINTLSEA